MDSYSRRRRIHLLRQAKQICVQHGAAGLRTSTMAPLSHVRFWVFRSSWWPPLSLYLGYAIHKIAKMEHGAGKAARSKPCAMRWKQHRALEETEEDHEGDPIVYPEMELESEKENKDQNQSKPKHDGRRRI